MSQPSDHETFGERLRRDLEKQRVSIRELGRRLSPSAPEVGRRQLQRWLADEVMPLPRTRAEIALALGLEADHYEEAEAA